MANSYLHKETGRIYRVESREVTDLHNDLPFEQFLDGYKILLSNEDGPCTIPETGFMQLAGVSGPAFAGVRCARPLNIHHPSTFFTHDIQIIHITPSFSSARGSGGLHIACQCMGRLLRACLQGQCRCLDDLLWSYSG